MFQIGGEPLYGTTFLLKYVISIGVHYGLRLDSDMRKEAQFTPRFAKSSNQAPFVKRLILPNPKRWVEF